MNAGSPVLHSSSPEATEAYGAILGQALRAGDVLLLEGELGAGKTCLVRGIVAGSGGDPTAVRSPTFVLHQPHRGATLTVHHLDLYRLGLGASVEVLDLESLTTDAAAVIEWGHYADLRHLSPATVRIASGRLPTERVLRLDDGAPPHLAAAWAAAVQARAS